MNVRSVPGTTLFPRDDRGKYCFGCLCKEDRLVSDNKTVKKAD